MNTAPYRGTMQWGWAEHSDQKLAEGDRLRSNNPEFSSHMLNSRFCLFYICTSVCVFVCVCVFKVRFFFLFANISLSKHVILRECAEFQSATRVGKLSKSAICRMLILHTYQHLVIIIRSIHASLKVEIKLREFHQEPRMTFWVTLWGNGSSHWTRGHHTLGGGARHS